MTLYFHLRILDIFIKLPIDFTLIIKPLTLRTKYHPMDIATEKDEVLKRFERVNDLSLIRAIKNLLDFGLRKQGDDDALEDSLARGQEESLRGEVTPHEEVMKEIRVRYKV
jgi:predicted transcriptional regulator